MKFKIQKHILEFESQKDIYILWKVPYASFPSYPFQKVKRKTRKSIIE